jgi:hypothetical protein
MIDGLEHNVSPLLLDLDPGKQWYADPHFHRSSSMSEYDTHQGTFWHKECQGYDCANCRTIPFLPDFKKRLTRETESKLKRGTRISEKGLRLEHMQRKELIESVRMWQSRAKMLDLDRYWLNLHAPNLSKSKESLTARLE